MTAPITSLEARTSLRRTAGGVLLALALVACQAAPSLPRPPIPAGEDPLRWQADIEALETAPAGVFAPVVFVGSSSIRFWSTLAADMEPMPVLNQGFGGSRLFDAVYWVEELVLAHAPSVVVLFSGTNDIAGPAPKSPARVAKLFEQFVGRLRANECDAPLVYLAISPTRAREQHVELVFETNRLIAALCEQDPSLTFVDTAHDLLGADGRPDPRWFRDDALHLNAAGYARWTQRIKPVVLHLYEARAQR